MQPTSPDSPTQVRIPALMLPQGEELEPLDLNEVAEALRRDGYSYDPAERGHKEVMRGSKTPQVRSAGSPDAAWRLIVPRHPGTAGSSQDLLDALAPLSDRREALEPLYFDVDPARSDYDAVGAFSDRYADEIGETTYFLIAGTGAEIPFALQRQLAAGKAVGRLGFPSIEGYATYARKVVEAEKHAPAEAVRPMLNFGLGSDKATSFSTRALIEPAGRMLKTAQPDREILSLTGEQATMPALLEALSADRGPSLLFSATHGAELADPRGADQGALGTCNRILLRATDIAGRTDPFLKYGIALLFACNGAGTPRDRWWLSILPHPPASSPGEDTLAALPLAMLSLLEGPLAVISHLDVLSDRGLRSHAWEMPASLDDPGAIPLRNALRALARGVPAGMAMRPIARATAELQSQLNRTVFQQGRMPGPHDVQRNIELGRAWMRWHDVQGWILLGDPRVCVEGVAGKLTTEDTLRGD